jgi:predicted nuclease of predicted toxin-antitoxin system
VNPRWLAAKGHEAEHVADQEMEAASDAATWEYAFLPSAAIITKDEDFAQRKVLAAEGPAVVWGRLPKARRGELLAWFEMILPAVLSALERGETLNEVA